MAGYSANSGEVDDRFLEKIWNHRWLLLASSLAGASWGFSGIFFMTRVLGLVDSADSETSRGNSLIWMFANISICGMVLGVPWSAFTYRPQPANQALRTTQARIFELVVLNFSVVGKGIIVGLSFLLITSFFSAIVHPGASFFSASQVFLSLGFFLIFGLIFGFLLALISMIPAGIIMAPLTQTLWDAIARENTKHQDLSS